MTAANKVTHSIGAMAINRGLLQSEPASLNNPQIHIGNAKINANALPQAFVPHRSVWTWLAGLQTSPQACSPHR
jgi:hypothetical protein